ncbi:MAG: pilus assembly protein [Propionibacteriaceae bacterium]|jgi:Flp pilus assembly protein TadG|nr:pilus assembly protein [Propionibacteriaceae bacterium]
MKNQLEHLSSDKGGITLWAVIVVAALFVTIGLIVDGSAMINAYQRANSIAREAARVAGQQVIPAAPAGDAVVLDPYAAQTAGLAYLATAGCDGGTITIVGGTIDATCPYHYTTIFLPGNYHATGTGNATPLWVR